MRQDVFSECRSGVVQICLEREHERVTAGSAFLVPGGLVTNSHVLREVEFEVAVFRFEDMDYEDGIRLESGACMEAIAHESPVDEHDVLYLRLQEPEFEGRHMFEFGDSRELRVGDEVGFLGYPFQMPHLTCHVGNVSSVHSSGTVDVIQLDGSVNGGNSGGPVIALRSGNVVGIVTRAEVGFLADQFENLLRTLKGNVELLEPLQGSMRIGSIDVMGAIRSSQIAALQIAFNLRRSANVGIGYAFSSNYIRDSVNENPGSTI